MINITFDGNIGKDCEVRQAGDSTVCDFSVASQTGFGDRAKTQWVKCSVWGKRAESVNFTAGLVKGQQVFISGELSVSEYNGKIYMDCRVNSLAFGKAPKLQDVQQQPQNSRDSYNGRLGQAPNQTLSPPDNQQMGSHQRQPQPPAPQQTNVIYSAVSFDDFDDDIGF